MTREDDLNIWREDKWAQRRDQYQKYQKWYAGKPLNETLQARDRSGTTYVKKYPLQLNIVGLACDVHRDIARGIPMHDDPLVIRAAVERRGENEQYAANLEYILNDKIWRASGGGMIQQEGLLSMNIYGGVGYRIQWAPWDIDLPYGLAVRLIRRPEHLQPEFDEYNPKRMVSCYYGYKISPKLARAKYNVDPDGRIDDDVLYLEYWDSNEWWVHVDGKVPTMESGGKKWQLRGKNPWGFVPFYYIPHERTADLWGYSQIEGQGELELEYNARAADISLHVKNMRSGVVVGSDISTKIMVTPVIHEGQTILRVIDIGHTKGIQGAQSPKLVELPIPDVPDSVMDWPKTLLDMWMIVERISPATFGMDDTQSGRITGPAVANRMWTSVAHATTERINYTTMKSIIDKDILRILGNELTRADIDATYGEVPEVGQEDYRLEISQSWPPMLPMDRTERHQELIDDLREGGISIERFLSEKGVMDTKTEMDRIASWKERMAQFEPRNMFGSQPNDNDTGSEPDGQGV